MYSEQCCVITLFRPIRTHSQLSEMERWGRYNFLDRRYEIYLLHTLLLTSPGWVFISVFTSSLVVYVCVLV